MADESRRRRGRELTGFNSSSGSGGDIKGLIIVIRDDHQNCHDFIILAHLFNHIEDLLVQKRRIEIAIMTW